MLLLDTSALIYWTLDPIQLSEKAGLAILGTDRIIASSISIWEIALKVKRGALQIPLPIAQYVERLQMVNRLVIMPVSTRNWLDSVALDWSHRDPADRVIVGLATRENWPLISNDRVISAFYPRTLW